MPDHVDADGNLILDWDGEERRRIDLEVGELCWNGAGDVMSVALDDLVEGYVGVVRGVAGELDFEVAVERGGCERSLRQAEAHADDGELRAACGLDHVQVAIAVARVEGLYGCGNQEITLAGVADPFTASSMADSIDFVHWVRHVIAESGLIEVPRLVSLRRVCLGADGGERGQREQ